MVAVPQIALSQEVLGASCGHGFWVKPVGLFCKLWLAMCGLNHKMQAMTDNIRLPDELGQQLQAHRKARGLSKSALAERAGKVREVIYRLEAGEDTTVSSLMAVMGALGLVMRMERAGLPTASEVAARFMEDDDAA